LDEVMFVTLEGDFCRGWRMDGWCKHRENGCDFGKKWGSGD